MDAPPFAGHLTRIDEHTWTLAGTPHVEVLLPIGPVFVTDGSYVLPGGGSADAAPLHGSGVCWVLPADPFSPDPAWQIRATAPASPATSDRPAAAAAPASPHASGQAHAVPSITAVVEVRFGADGCRVLVRAPHVTVPAHVTMTAHRARPHTDIHGDGFTLDFPGGELLSDALAGFYWGTMLPCVVERTTAAGYPDPEGYVISTLANTYVGTYPDVDHEFQIKGRLAVGSALDQAVVRRMIELQLRLMREDPQGLWRDPCAVQPGGEREYHVRRNSLDGTANAVMFLVTGNVEVLESVWLYVARTKDLGWLRANLGDIEGAASCVEDCVDRLGRLWSDVYYEDQVIKDGRETLAAASAVRSFALLAELESLLGRASEADRYTELSQRISAAIGAPLPNGYWDPVHRRFVDWVDRSGAVHDHLHLLANVLPVLSGSASPEQQEAVTGLIDRELGEFQRFPTFLAARIADYTDAEIGDGGPYDLCAAGRYWCWDAAYWSWRGNGEMLRDQLRTVARQGAADAWIMGERYDMDHVYYVDGSPWHGAAHYYEYPNVYAWVLIHEYLGVRPSLGADLLIAPRLTGFGEVILRQEAYRLSYAYGPGRFAVRNVAPFRRTFIVDLSVLFPGAAVRSVTLGPGAVEEVGP